MTARQQLPLDRLPDVPGRVHGIVSEHPPTIQCDGCGLLESPHPRLAMAILLSSIKFNARRRDGRRLCRECDPGRDP